MAESKKEQTINQETDKNVLDTIQLMKEKYHFHSDAALAKAIGVNTSTWTSFLNKPSSVSKAKNLFCAYFNINPLDLDSGRLLKENDQKTADDSPKDLQFEIPSEDEIPLVDMDTYDIYTKALLHCHDISDHGLYELNKDVIKKLKFKMTLVLAKKHLLQQEYISAYMAYNSAFLDLNANHVESLLGTDIKNFVLLSEKLNEESGLAALVDKLISEELYRINIVYYLSSLLEENFVDLSKKCLQAILNNE